MTRQQGRKDEMDRAQKKRMQNREAQQKYRVRVKDRISALEAEIRELRSHSQNEERGKLTTQVGSTGETNAEEITCHVEDDQNTGSTSRGTTIAPDADAARPTLSTLVELGHHQNQCLDASPDSRTQFTPNVDFEMLSEFSPAHSLLPIQFQQDEPEWSWQGVTNNLADNATSPLQKLGFPGHVTINGSSAQVGRQPTPPTGPLKGSSSHGARQSTSGKISSHLSFESFEDILPDDLRGPTPDSSIDSKLSSRSLEEPFEFVQRYLSRAGFSTIDEMVGQYYTADFSHESEVSSSQRTSRHSELPVLLSSLRQDTKRWTQWEAHGYEAEIIKSATSIIRTERTNFILNKQQSYVDKFGELGVARSKIDHASLAITLRPLTRLLQDNVPKLWALVESLLNSDKAFANRDRSYTALAIVLLLCKPQQIPKHQMLAIMTRCLEMLYDSPI